MGVSSHVLKSAQDEGRQGKTVTSVAKEKTAVWRQAYTAQNYKTSENKDQDSCPVWAITAVKDDVLTWLRQQTCILDSLHVS